MTPANKHILYSSWFIGSLLALLALGFTLQNLLLPLVTINDLPYTNYNNYLIFKQSFFHLLGQKDLYVLYPAEHFDFYKYSPSFALLMAPLAYLPDWLGLYLWNLLNTLVLFFALWKLQGLSPVKRLWILAIILLELITSLQNSQSNGLMAGLLVLAFSALEKKHIAAAALFIVLSMYIKIFGIVALALFLFYPQKRKAALYTIGWLVLLGLLPLLVTSWSTLVSEYQSWWQLLQKDHNASTGLSVSGWLYTWFNIDAQNAVTIAGMALFCLPLLRFSLYGQWRFRVLLLCSILIWIVIFNHKAESPTFIIALSGVAIWYVIQPRHWINMLLLILVCLFTVLSPTDIFPRSWREAYVVPYVLKAVPCILVWLKLNYDMLVYQQE